MTLQGKVAIVTGGNTGIGKAVALAYAGQGASIVIDYVADPDTTEALGKQLRDLGDQVTAVKADVSKIADLEKLLGIGRGGSAASSCAPVVFTSPAAGDAAPVAGAVITCRLLLTVTRCSRRTGSAGSRPGIPGPAVQPGRGRAGGRGRRVLR